MRSRLARWADLVWGERCRYGCGQRIFYRDRRAHEDTNHAGDTL